MHAEEGLGRSGKVCDGWKYHIGTLRGSETRKRHFVSGIAQLERLSEMAAGVVRGGDDCDPELGGTWLRRSTASLDA